MKKEKNKQLALDSLISSFRGNHFHSITNESLGNSEYATSSLQLCEFKEILPEWLIIVLKTGLFLKQVGSYSLYCQS